MQEVNNCFKSERLIMRRWRIEDAPQLFLLASDPVIGTQAGWAPHQNIEDSENVIRNVFNSNNTTWAVEMKSTHLVIGAIGYGASCDCNLPARENEPTIGYWIGKNYWNQGFCTEALHAMIAHIKKSTDIPSLISGHFIDNPASGRVMEKCGFVGTGETVIDEYLFDGKNRPIRVLRLEIM